jgi:hypothetical protein
VATAAVGVPATVWLRRSDPAAAPGAKPTRADNPRVRLPWRPTWVPEGLVERYRSAGFEGDATTDWLRQWGPSPGSAADQAGLPAVSLRMARRDDLPKAGRRVSVNGQPAYVYNEAGGPECGVTWLAAPHQLLTASVTKMSLTGDPEEVALRVARSVAADPAAALEVSVGFGWLPTGFRGDKHTFALGVSVDRGATVSPKSRVENVLTHGRAGSAFLTIGGHQSRPDGAEPATVRDRPGWVASRELVDGEVYVALADGRPFGLAVQAGSRPKSPLWTRADLVRIADEVRLGPTPDLSWIGRR